MKGRYIAIGFLCFLTIYLSLYVPHASAIMIGLSTEDLTRASEAVIMGDVENAEAQWSEDGKTIFTTATVLVTDVFKGRKIERRITVEFEGGEVGDTGLKVSDVSLPKKGEKVILFLKSNIGKKGGIIFNTVGKAQGKYIVGKNGIARKSGFSLLTGREVVTNNIPVNELIKKIKEVKE
jgi:hypothetical protein